MHQIQKLEIVGFKSFCDRTQIVFHEGCTAIVGPNGCGKSNIADAISWVVGEQSAKSLRTDRMEGVIFNGTQARKATNFSEVVLSLSLKASPNLPEGFKLDLNPEGFTVGRRLYRSGESEYYLDGRRCRLKDIQALFEGTGLGPNSYALIEQGRIGQILSSKPADRRALIEEAARITLFKSRRYSAEMKLELAQQNLLRVNDIVHEVTRNLNSLRRQAAKARRYNRLREELRNLHKLKLGMEQRDLQTRLEQSTVRFAAAQEQERAILSSLAQVEESRTAGQELCRAQDERLNETRDQLAGLRVEAGNAAGRRQSQETQSRSLAERVNELDRELGAIAERGQLVEREQERLAQASAGLTSEIASEQEVLESEQARSEVLQEAMRATEARIEETRTFLLNRAGKLADLKNQHARCDENLKRIAARVDRIQAEQEVEAGDRSRQQDQLAGVQKGFEANTARLKEISDQQAALEIRSDQVTKRLDSVSAELAGRQEEYSIMQHRYTSLEEVERRRTNYSEGVQKFLSTQVPGEQVCAAQTLADLLETDPAYEAAVEDYLNDPLQYIVVGRLEDAVQSVERVKRIGAGKCTFMTLRNGHTHHQAAARPRLAGDGVVGYLDELLRMREDVREAFERALPDFASTVMVSDLPTAFKVAETHADTNFLTLNGEAYSPKGTLSAVGERKAMAGFLALKREKRELERNLASLRARIDRTRAEVAVLKTDQASVAENLKSLGVEARKLDIEKVVLHHQIERLEGELKKLEQSENVAALELSQLRAERSELEARRAEAAAGIEEIEQRSRVSSEELQELSGRLESLKSENSALSKVLASLASAHAVKQERLSGIEAELQRLAREAEDVRRRTGANHEEKAQAVAGLVELERARAQTEAQIAELTRQTGEAETTLSERQKELSVQRDVLAALEERLRGLHAEREKAMGVRGAIEIEKTRIESDLEHLRRNCEEEFHLPLEEILTEIEESDWQRDHAEVIQSFETLRERIESFGPINMRALEEYQELEERYQFLSSQRADIEQSIADTQRAIAEINRRSVEQFQDAFKNIRENFIEVFQILFKGGQCDLRLLDEGDLLESGVDIVAQPPGKRLQNVLLLSGGEKALTALALLIAIFRYRPSPFCVLDEVDAPLDDANVMRFTELISTLSKETQFLIITHNKKTMEIAQTLYGVTMEEPGVSKIVSVDFRTHEEALAS
ncbi:MAG: chromosome segregation protein SMC [Acidobacteriia bacterium]|nr:chromosome segregation protein SMC [Terriglobia bacterium]